ncbi:hypothetical protein J437_LFUL009516, partial [Ladona fulva]
MKPDCLKRNLSVPPPKSILLNSGCSPATGSVGPDSRTRENRSIPSAPLIIPARWVLAVDATAPANGARSHKIGPRHRLHAKPPGRETDRGKGRRGDEGREMGVVQLMESGGGPEGGATRAFPTSDMNVGDPNYSAAAAAAAAAAALSGMLPFDPMHHPHPSHHHPHHHPHHHHHHHPGLYDPTAALAPPPPKPRFVFKMPRVVPDQKSKFESDELFRRLSRESEVRYTGYRDRPQEERQLRFQNGCREGHTEI